MEQHYGTEMDRFMNAILKKHALKNDAALSRAIGVAPPVVSKVRNGKIPLMPSFMLALHEKLGMSIADMRKELPAEAFFDAKPETEKV